MGEAQFDFRQVS